MVLAAIQIGTDESGSAFKFCSDFRNDTIKTSSSEFASGTSAPQIKFPNSVLLDPDQSFVAFGHDADDTYRELVYHQRHTDWYYFHQFTKNIPVLVIYF